jgi:hypothetical protein
VETIRFFRDEHGYAAASASTRWHFLTAFLESDVQGDVAGTRDLIERVESYRDGLADAVWEGTGNAWTLVLTPGERVARLDLEVVTDEDIWGTVPLDLLLEMLRAWEHVLTTDEEQTVTFEAYDPGPNTG